MTGEIEIILDEVVLSVKPGLTILEAAEAAGVYIPRLCYLEGLVPWGGCRVCTVLANGRPVAACTQPVTPGMVIENDSERNREHRRQIVEMLFIEGNHFCMACEKSGNCELQALAYRLGITAPRYPFQFPKREVDASHPDILIDHNRCILCARCVRASRNLDGKQVFGFVGRGKEKRVAVRAGASLESADVADRALLVCPVGALLRKRTGFRVPVGRRDYDDEPIGSTIERRSGREGDGNG